MYPAGGPIACWVVDAVIPEFLGFAAFVAQVIPFCGLAERIARSYLLSCD